MTCLKWTLLPIMLMAMTASAQFNRLNTLQRSDINRTKFKGKQYEIENREDRLEEVPMNCQFVADTVKVRAVQDCGTYEGIISAKVECDTDFASNVRFDVLCADDDRNLTAEECVKESFFNFVDKTVDNTPKHFGWQHQTSDIPQEVLDGGTHNLGDQ